MHGFSRFGVVGWLPAMVTPDGYLRPDLVPASGRGRQPDLAGRKRRLGRPGANCPSRRSRPILIFKNRLDSSPNQKHDAPVPRSSEGRFAIVTDVERGMRWTQRRVRRTRPLRTAKSCGPGAPTLASSAQDDDLARDGGKKARFPGESTKDTVKTIAQGMPDLDSIGRRNSGYFH
jgi:hypothetical protein